MNVKYFFWALLMTGVFGICLYTAIDGLNVWNGYEKCESYAEAIKTKNLIEKAIIDYGGELKYIDINKNNNVSFSIRNAGDGFPYVHTRTGWWNWLLLSVQSFFLLTMWLKVKKSKPINPWAVLNAVPLRVNSPRNTPKQIGDGTAKYRGYTTRVVREITLPRETSGIIAMRDWRLNDHKLHSLIVGSEWTGKTVIADKIPTPQNNNGIYAYQLGRRGDFSGDVTGIVSLSGKCQVGQKDGVIRAQRCDILVLVAEADCAGLSTRYGVPAFSIGMDYDYLEKWLISDEGIYWLKHNNDLLRSVTQKEIDPIKQIEEIMRNEKF